MSFRMGVFIEAISNRAAAEKETGVATQGVDKEAASRDKQPKRRESRKKTDAACVEPSARRRPHTDITGH